MIMELSSSSYSSEEITLSESPQFHNPIQKNRLQYQNISRVSYLLHQKWKSTTPMNQWHFRTEGILLIPISVESASSIEAKNLFWTTTLYYRQTTELQGTLLAKTHRCELHE